MMDILEQIWHLPWYKMMVVSAVDDIIVLLKLWWLWAGILVWAIGVNIMDRKSNHTK